MTRFGIAGWSGSGKTTLVVALIPALIDRGLRVSTVKHAHHSFDIDQPGKDSYRHRGAGATEVMVSSASRWALVHENRGDAEASLDQITARMSPVDLVLVEGFKRHPIDKIEVYRESVGKPPLWAEDARVVAVATDAERLDTGGRPVLDLGDVSKIADFIIAHCGLKAVARPQAS